MMAADTLTKQVDIRFNGTASGTTYTLGSGEIDNTRSFKVNGTPTISGGVATLKGVTTGGWDGFDFNPATLGALTGRNWVAEAIVSFSDYTGRGGGTIIDVQGDSDLRFNNAYNHSSPPAVLPTPTVLQAGYWDGTDEDYSMTAPLPAVGEMVHVALVWDAAASSMTAYLNGGKLGTVDRNAFEVPDSTNVSFGYFGRTGFDARGIAGSLDAVAFTTFTGGFNPNSDFSLVAPVIHDYRYWDINGLTAGAGGGGTPYGNWSDASWSTSVAGTAAAAVWKPGAEAVFSAGDDASSVYKVTLNDTKSALSVTIEEGDVTLEGGALQILDGGYLKVVAPGFLEIHSAVSAGDLTITGNLLIAEHDITTGILTLGPGGMLEVEKVLTVGALKGSGNLRLGDGTLTTLGTVDAEFSGVISGNGGFIKKGIGKQTLLNATHSFEGDLVLEQGSLETGPVAGNGTSGFLGAVNGQRTVSTATGTTLIFRQANVFGGSLKTADSIPMLKLDGTLQTIRFNILGNTRLQNGGRLVNSSTETAAEYGGFQFLGTVTVDGTGPASTITSDASTRQIHLMGGSSITFEVADVTGNADPDLIVSSVVTDGSGDYPGVGGLVKSGPGTMSLSGMNTYSGETSVTAGVLAVNGNAIADANRLSITGGKVAATGVEGVGTLFINGVQKDAGTWGATGSNAAHIDDLHFSGTAGTVSVATGPGAGVTYNAWIAGFPGVTIKTAFVDDADGDGLANGVEYLLGSNPDEFGTALFSLIKTGSEFRFRHQKSKTTTADSTLAYQWSSDLVTWHASGTAGAGTTVTLTPAVVVAGTSPAPDTVEVVATVTGTPATTLFVRLTAVH